jgi:urease accessory protein
LFQLLNQSRQAGSIENQQFAGMNIEAFLSLLQFTDGLFPAGAYAHSFGLEFYVQAGAVRDAAGVEAFLRTLLEGSSGPTDVVVAMCAWRAAGSDDLETCLRIDRTFDAMKPAAELRNASRQMGRQVLRIASRQAAHRLVRNLFRAAERGVTPGHHPIAFGAVGSVLGWRRQETAAAYLYSTSAAVVAAALRLLPLGQSAGQEILWNLQPSIGRLAKETEGKASEDIWSFAPGLEIAAMRHATLDARLFRS